MPFQIPASLVNDARDKAWLAANGFRWCKKDKRFECKKNLTERQINTFRLHGFLPRPYGKPA